VTTSENPIDLLNSARHQPSASGVRIARCVHNSGSKKTAQDSLKAIDAKYNTQITAILTPEQAKSWKRMQKDWKDDLSRPKS